MHGLILTFCLQILSLFMGARVLNIDIRFFGCLLLTTIPMTLCYLFNGTLGYFLCIASIVVIIRRFDDNAKLLNTLLFVLVAIGFQFMLAKFVLTGQIDQQIQTEFLNLIQ
ncbi:hypothetical protein HR060_07840 [Catenovulum sp. SM1970]|uniref:hypothetical protein n=1 Tax=Marinifaba aquimaris TaxID=2741323 RepID=UPI0015722818|nr:hypothetical protein [Marinifaba aquimaris]NTS76780.1 hypothetical protein [Marinifaba aquimaris]